MKVSKRWVHLHTHNGRRAQTRTYGNRLASLCEMDRLNPTVLSTVSTTSI